MSDDHKYSVAAARAAAERNELDAWVARFLTSSGSDNAALAAKLLQPPRWWLGEIQGHGDGRGRPEAVRRGPT